MDGVHPLRCVEWRGCAAVVQPSAVVRLVPYSSHCSAGEYCCHVVYCSLPGVWCVGGECSCVLFVWWGILSLPSPLRWWRVGPSWTVGWHDEVGWHGEGRAVVLLDSPSNVGVPRLCVDVPPVVYSVALLNGGSGMCCDAPSSDWVRHLVLSAPLLIVCSPRIVLVPLRFCVAVFVVGGEVRWWTVSRPPLLSLCLLSQHCWFSAVSL